MKWVWDKTHRFRMRPEYTLEELDDQCEALVSGYLRKRHGEVSFPIRTDDLRFLVEMESESLILDSGLGQEGGAVEACTEFRPGHKPAVRIASMLATVPSLEKRFRAALAHQYGHVHFHDFLFQTEEGSWLSLFEGPPDSRPRLHRCRRDSVVPLSDDNWMEWQAGYVCGALLMPAGPLIAHVRDFRRARDLDHAALSERSLDGAALIREVAERFQTSWDTARTRLAQQRILAPDDTRSLF